jgi:hypothetical protein
LKDGFVPVGDRGRIPAGDAFFAFAVVLERLARRVAA